MRVFNRSALLFYAKRHADVRDDLLTWYAEAERAVWKSPAAVRRQFPRASVVANNRIVFDIGGNRYRDRQSGRRLGQVQRHPIDHAGN